MHSFLRSDFDCVILNIVHIIVCTDVVFEYFTRSFHALEDIIKKNSLTDFDQANLLPTKLKMGVDL